MSLKSLHLTSDHYVNVNYDQYSIPLVRCIENFDDYIGSRWDAHWHEGIEMTTVMQGSCRYTVIDNKNRREIVLKPGDGIFINAGVLNSVQALEPKTKTVCLLLPPTFFNAKIFTLIQKKCILPILNSGLSSITLRANQKAERTITKSIKEVCLLSEKEVDYELHSVELVCRILRLMIVQFRKNSHEKLDSLVPSSQEKRVRSAIQFIHENYQNPQINVDTIAGAISISRTECFRSFKSITNQTPIEYLNDYRMAMAKMMLVTTPQSIKEVALRCGFANPSYFSREFKKKFGLTPKKYRQTRLKK